VLCYISIMKRVTLFTLLLFFVATGWGQVNLDSLWSVWEDETQADTARLNTMHIIVRNGYLFTQPDSAFYFAQLQYDFAKSKGLKKHMAAALNTQGVSFAIQGDYTSALGYYTRGLTIYEEIGDKRGIANSFNNFGIAYRVQGDHASSLDYHTRSLNIREEIGDKPGIAGSLNNIGSIYYDQGDYASAIDYYTQSLTIDEEFGDKPGIAASLNNIGLIYENQDDHVSAINYYTRSLTIMEEMGDKPGIAASLNNIGLIYMDQDDYANAIDYYTQSLTIYEGIRDKQGIATSLNNIGVIYYNQGDYASAMDYHTRSLAIDEEIGNKQGIATSLNNIGNIYQEQSDYTSAIDYSIRALTTAQEVGAAIETRNAASALYEAYKATGRHHRALEMYELYIATRDSILSEENQKEVIRQGFKYEYDKQHLSDSLSFVQQKELDNLSHHAELDKEVNQRYGLYGGLGFLFLLGGVAFRGYQRKKKDNLIIQRQKVLVEARNKEVTDSINYARRIQSAILPTDKVVKEHLKESFILYKPKDIVAGDFYWMDTVLGVGDQKEQTILFAAADCTGHGVPGAMVSVVCHNALNNAVREFKITEPAAILDKVNAMVTEQFSAGEYGVKDGMDIALVSLNTKTRQATYAGANNPLYHISKGELHQIKADKQPIGAFAEAKSFSNRSIKLKKGDTIYLSTDGFSDQFGGPKGKKFKYEPFRELLISVQGRSMEDQRQVLDESFEDWRGELEQVDDVCVIGVRV